MYNDLDQFILSGGLDGASRSSSPVRSASGSCSPSPDPQWPDKGAYDSDNEFSKPASIHGYEEGEGQRQSIGMGPGRTGVKGVIRDRAEAVAQAKTKRSAEIAALNKKLEHVSLAAGGKTWAEDEDVRRVDQGLEPIHGSRTTSSASTAARFGHLREVGANNFVEAVEESGANVVVHIYDSSLERCAEIDEALVRAARTSPHTKFLRARAAAIGYASLGRSATGALGPKSTLSRNDKELYTLNEHSDFSKLEHTQDDLGGDCDYVYEEEDVDLDMLPTILVYRDGELLHTWVRVDWEAGKDGIENFLLKHNIIARRSRPGAQGLAALSDDEESFEDEW